MLKKIFVIISVILTTLCLSAKDTVKIACVGDSITDGFGLMNASLDSWPALLGDMLGDNYDVRNFGHTGKTLQRNGDQSYWNVDKFKKAKSFNPDIVIIKLGTNDAKEKNWQNPENFRHDLSDFISEFQDLPSKPKIYLSTCAWVRKDAISITEQRVLEGVIPIIKDTAKKRGLKVLDFHSLLKDKPQVYCDDIHPNEAGALLMAQFVYKNLTGKNPPKPSKFRGKKSDFFGFQKIDSNSLFRNTSLYVPNKPNGKWFCTFKSFKNGKKNEMFLKYLKDGYYVITYDIEGGLGSPEYMKIGDRFFKYYAKLLDVKSKPVLFGEGLSALFVINYAAKNPDKVESTILENPVKDALEWANQSPQNMKRYKQEWRIK